MYRNFNVTENNRAIEELMENTALSEIGNEFKNEVIRSYVTESKLNTGLFVHVLVCRSGKRYVVSGDYLEPYEKSPNINGLTQK